MSPGDKFLYNGCLWVYHKMHQVPSTEGSQPQHVAYRIKDGYRATWTYVEEFAYPPVPVRFEHHGSMKVRSFNPMQIGEAVCATGNFIKVGEKEILSLDTGRLWKWNSSGITCFERSEIHVTR